MTATTPKTKKGYRPKSVTLYYLVRLAGIEPTTPWFVAKYSIQLSYSRVKREYNTTSLRFGRGISNEQENQAELLEALGAIVG